MNNTTHELVIIIVSILCIWGLREILVTMYNNIKIRHYMHIIRTEKTRHYFADLRHRLIDLTIKNELDPNSSTFQALYSLYTIIMRRPDQYKVISQNILYSIISESNDTSEKSSMEMESHSWSNSIRNIVRDTAEGLMMIIIDYSAIIRFFYNSTAKLLNINSLEFLSPIIIKLREDIEKARSQKDPTINSFKTAKNNLSQLAVC